MKTILLAILLVAQSVVAQSVGEQAIKHLKSINTIYVGKDGTKKTVIEQEFLIQADAGRTQLSNYPISFNGDNRNFRLLQAYSEHNGTRTTTSAKDVTFVSSQIEASGLIDAKKAIVPFIKLQLNTKVLISYEIYQEPEIKGIFQESLGISNISLADTEVYRVESAIPFKSLMLQQESSFAYKEWQEKDIWKAELKPSPLAYELLGKKIVATAIILSSAPTWATVTKIVSPGYNSVTTGVLHPEMSKIINSAKRIKVPKEQIEFVATEVNKLVAYSGTWLSTDQKFYPRAFTESLGKRKGDCKDFSAINVAILNRLGFTAFPALTFRSFRYAGEENLKLMAGLPAPLYFNHAIVWAKDPSGKEWWIDPTNPMVIADVITSDILGNFALILDGKSENVTFLPKENSEKNKMAYEQRFKLNPDGTASVTGKVLLNAVAYNNVGMLERQNGIEAVKNLIIAVVARGNKIDMTLKKHQQGQVPFYEYSYIHPGKWKSDPDGWQRVKILHPLVLLLDTIGESGHSDLGELSEMTLTTKVEGVEAQESYKDDFYRTSPWFEGSRTVENSPGAFTVYDTLKIKKRSILSKEKEELTFKSAIVDFNVSYNLWFKIKDEKKVLSAAEVAEQDPPELGPDVYKMSEEDVIKLNGPMGASEHGYYRALKTLKYSFLKLKKNPNDATALSLKAFSIAKFGFGNPRFYQAEYASDAKQINLKAISLLNGQFNRLIYRNQLNIDAFLNDQKAILASLARYSASSPKDFEYYLVNSDVAISLNNHTYMNGWLAATEKVAKTNAEKNLVLARRLDFLIRQDKPAYEEQVKLLKQMIVNEPKNARLHGQLAEIHLTVKHSEQAIESARNAVALTEQFWAKKLLSIATIFRANQLQDIYETKVKTQIVGPDGKRMPSSFRPNEKEEDIAKKRDELVSESIKLDPNNQYSYVVMYNINHFNYLQSKNEDALQKIKYYAKRIIELDANSQYAIKIRESLAKLAITL